MKKTLLVAHRGGSLLAPENTMAAFKNALKLGVDRIELDVQQSNDGVVMVIHDEKINRTTTGKGNISKLTFNQLLTYDAGIKFSKHYAGEKIPTLDEVLSLVCGQCTILIEIKNPDNIYLGIEKNVADLIVKHNALSWCTVQSFEYESLLRLHKINQNITTGLLIENPKPKDIINNKIDTSFISEINISQRFASKKSIDFIHALNKKVFVWTVNKPERMKKLIQSGVDGIITDDPKTLKALISD